MLQYVQQRRYIIKNCQQNKLQHNYFNPIIWWSGVILDMVNIWPALWCTEEMLYLAKSMSPYKISNTKKAYNLLTGAQLGLKLVLIFNLLPSYLEGTLVKVWELLAWLPTQLQLLKCFPELIINLISCMLKEHLCIGMLEKEWNKGNFHRPDKI